MNAGAGDGVLCDCWAMSEGEMEREVWIGLVEVVPEEGNDIFDGAPGGYANVLALACSVEDYMAVTAPALLNVGVIAVGVDDPEPLRERLSRVDVSEEIEQIVVDARAGEVVWDTFYVFETDEDASLGHTSGDIPNTGAGDTSWPR